MTPDLEKEGVVASTSSKTAPEIPKENLKGAYKKQKGPRRNKRKGKGKENWNRSYPQQYRISKLEPSDMDSVFDVARSLMELTAKEQERMKRTFPGK
ncbi:hypothetical protein O181_008736 [Austropuccinia psidii MF-1]|uniref:Uncharacterized protein n=1 Tax=Austropuccinia psidii MF-1 TaxID=1389203 RepID=A0A9Q3BN16_9BASI|nr:hypothetical protein [Austropuccinia psidii MF-1]